MFCDGQIIFIFLFFIRIEISAGLQIPTSNSTTTSSAFHRGGNKPEVVVRWVPRVPQLISFYSTKPRSFGVDNLQLVS